MTANTNPGRKEDLLRRLKAVRPKRWMRFTIVALLYTLWAIWLGNLWVLLALPLLFDIYITGYIPFTWWKKSPSKVTRTLMSWIDALVYALVLVYFIFAFIGQNYKIPSSSLEKTLLVGDYLWVNKAVYGPRVPQTPLHFPLAQHTLPVAGTKSYLDFWQLPYHRLPGLREVERYDIVVFNSPTGDTVPLNKPEPDYYHLVYELETSGTATDGRAYIAAHPEIFGKVVARPVDRRENFVKRAVGLPGDRLKIVDDTVYINGKALPEPKYVQHNYLVPVSAPISPELWKSAGLSMADIPKEPYVIPGLPMPVYDVPLTSEALETVKGWTEVAGTVERRKDVLMPWTAGIFPVGAGLNWSLKDMGEIWIPKQGSTLRLTPENLPVYRRAIETYEGHKVEQKPDGTILIDGKPAKYYTFAMDYYWMMGDNRDNSSDSRFWGFVPEDHIVGTPMTVLISFDPDKGLPGVRWDRILRTPNPEK